MTAPTPGSRVSSLTLTVRIDFKLQPYQITEDYDHQLLAAALKHHGTSTSVEILAATDSTPWVALQQVFIRSGGQETVSNSEIEARYRKTCAEAGGIPTQADFLAYCVSEYTGIQIGSF